MLITNNHHLTYCTNIHSEKSWTDLFECLSKNILEVKEKTSPYRPFGIGLRLSDYSSKELLEGKNLMKFKNWLNENNLYVFTMNGFPYGTFHNKAVKDDVHKPDWTTKERVAYTKQLCRILAVLLPKELEGGISTSPLSYKPWHQENNHIEDIFKRCALHLAMIVEEMINIRRDTGKILHLDIETEPDGLLERSSEMIHFFENYLYPEALPYLMKKFIISERLARETIQTHIRVCYDICHFAVSFEDHKEAFRNFKTAGIKIGKVQISSALKATFNGKDELQKDLIDQIKNLNDPIYLHQVIEKDSKNNIQQYKDIPEAILHYEASRISEWRIHYHVPLFTKSYGKLSTTNDEVVKVLELLKEQKITDHLEVETYTWNILPESLKIDLSESISKELEWVMNRMNIHIEANE